MKTQLPTQKNFRGFTLIELLVVVAIIAILTLIGISVYAGVQKKARDGRRRVEIDSLAKSIEVRKDATVGTYPYGLTSYTEDYPNAKPQDPLGSSTRNYCYIGSKPADPAQWTTAACPAGGWVAVPTTGCLFGAGCSIVTTPSSWKVCASLEGSTGVFCKGSLN